MFPLAAGKESNVIRYRDFLYPNEDISMRNTYCLTSNRLVGFLPGVDPKEKSFIRRYFQRNSEKEIQTFNLIKKLYT